MADPFLVVQGVPESAIFDCGNSQQRYYAAPNDCHSFYQCFDTIGPPVKMSCGFLHFNPIQLACDWPANVISIRPECDKTFTNFGRRNFARRLYGTRIVTTATTTTTKTTTTTASTTTHRTTEEVELNNAKVIHLTKKAKYNIMI